ncbi:Crp/Fnr family transcriptional regulator [Dyadobacter aurulentus]|uniref:Crp/Fnr family transcriptional regulator n=1 Tax=Dyadobacter sp. UC 10 TaxID=2605428 RepID=UPI0011F395A0|nr:Crp/Fnr family transcriptional regulator [Dyadobacter sp. UC 10]KAA0992306.1 Crp/Fnr family transcriptional regulator [Dyadobacter sp. UC 10]
MNEVNEYAKLRSAIEGLVDLSDQEWNALKSAFTIRVVRSKTIITREGDIANELYFVCSGLARLFYHTKDSDQITAFIFSENMFASCLESFINQQPSIQTLETLEDCTLLVLSKENLETLYAQLPKSHVIMRKVMEARFISAQQLLSSYILASPQERYGLFAVRYPELVQRVPQYILASFLGITPVSLSRIRKRIARPD